MSNKKNFISVKRGLSQDPKHREHMGNRIWLFLHIIDRTDWETGIVNDWRDKDEADDMGMAWRTLQKQRQELEEAGYILCHKKRDCQNITVYNWHNPRNYSGEVVNPKSTQKRVFEDVESTQQSTQKGVLESTQKPNRDLGTPSIRLTDHIEESQITGAREKHSRAPDPEIMNLSQKFVSLTGIPWPEPKTKAGWAKASKLWIAPLKEMNRLSNGQSENILSEAVRQMRKDGLTIYAPISVEKVFVSIYGEKHRQMEAVATSDPFASLYELIERQEHENNH